jgi:hypothetical protein
MMEMINGRQLRRSATLSIVGALISLSAATVAHSATLAVCKTGCVYTSVQTAITMAKSGDTITIGAGTYFENIKINGKSLTLIGAGEDYTVLDGSSRGSVVTVGQIYTTVPGTKAAIIGVTVTHGASTYGSGIVVFNAVLDLQNSAVVGNRSNDKFTNGGGVYISGEGLPSTITKSIIAHNSSTLWGGGIFVEEEGTVIISNSSITRNSSSKGGGLYIEPKSFATVTASTFSDNGATADGAGIYIAASQVHVPGGHLTMSDTTLADNHAQQDGGGIFGGSTSGTLTNVVLSQNSAGRNGGGLDLGAAAESGGTAYLPGIVIVRNSAAAGGGVYVVGDVQSSNSLITGNQPNDCVATQGGCP